LHAAVDLIQKRSKMLLRNNVTALGGTTSYAAESLAEVLATGATISNAAETAAHFNENDSSSSSENAMDYSAILADWEKQRQKSSLGKPGMSSPNNSLSTSSSESGIDAR
jgi:hypothetical protein